MSGAPPPPVYDASHYAVAHAALAMSGGAAAVAPTTIALLPLPQQQQQQGGGSAGLSPTMPMMPPPGIYTSYGHGTGMCDCPACELAQRYALVYSKQFPAMTPESAQAARVEAAAAANRGNVFCGMWDAFGFCFHGLTCMFPHRRPANDKQQHHRAQAGPENGVPASAIPPPIANSPFFAAERAAAAAAGGAFTLPLRDPSKHTVRELCAEIQTMVDEHSNGVFRCRVCAYADEFDVSCIIKVGEMFSYMTCPRCTAPLYQPLMLLLVEAVLRETGGRDHIAYKNAIDRLRSEVVPHMVRIPLVFEAHRLASTYFAWSLLGPMEAAEALTAAIVEARLPDATCIVSMGSGTGYVEHVFAEALKMLQGAKSSLVASASPWSSPEKDEAVLATYRKRLADAGVTAEALKSFAVLAFDEILRQSRFSVPVQYGTPDAINCLPDPTKSVLLLCWPPFGTPGGPHATMGHDVLRRYIELGGRSVVYIGDVASTGDYDFHCLLQQAFVPVPSYRTRHDVRRWVPQEMGLVYAGNDTVGVYRARDGERDMEFTYFAH